MNRDSFKRVAFSEKKLALLASILDEEGAQTEQTRGITRRENPHDYPLSAGQRRMWFLNQLEQGVHYNENFNLRLKGAVDIAILERTLQEILRRHEAMRSSFVVRDGQPVQRIVPTEPIRLPVIDLRAIPELDRHGEAVRLAVEEARRPFDFAKGPLWRFTLLLLAEDDCILLITAHHIATDGWSFGVFLKEFRLLYEAFRAAEPSPLSDPVIQYADYAAWQTEWLNSEAAHQQLSYWTHHLSGAPPFLELPADRPRPSIQTFRGARHQLTLSKPLTAALRDLSQHQGVTLFMTLLAVFQALISRHTARDDIIVGTPIANRTLPEIEGLIGYFVNTLVLRSDLSEDPTFVDLLQQVRQTTLGAFQNQDLPFEKLVDALRPQRTQSYTPLFQVLFVLQNLKPKWELPQLSLSPFRIDSGTAKFDLALFLVEGADDLAGWIEYATDLFDAARIERMAGHFLAMLEGIVSNPNERLSRLPLLTEAERHQLLVDWNETQVDYPANACIHELFEAQAQRTPEAVAVEFEGSQLCYRELNERANQLAHYLRGMGVGPDTLVGVAMERSLEMVVALYGVLKAGGAYVPIDPEYPPERVAFMLQDANVEVLLTQTRLAGLLPSHNGRVVCVDGEWEQIARQDVANPAGKTEASRLAYMIYTSGSTGRPKGAMNTHRGICNRLLWMQDQYGLTEADKVLQKTPFSFDVSVWEFFWPLLVGARLVVAEPGGHRDPAYLVKLIREQGITVLHFVPSMLKAFLEEPGVERCQSLRHVICSGEALPYDLQEQFFRLSPSQLHNLYGPTEAAVDVTHWTCRRDDERKIVPIGRPVANTQVYILDRHLQPVPIGVPGELHIGGVQVGRGYHKRPELTAEKFIPDPFSGDPQARLYKTGDLCRWLPDGAVEYLGRMDFQVKIRGLRVELGEIEDALRQHPAVHEAVVTAREDTPGDKRLVAYYTGVDTGEQGGAAVGAEELRRHLARSLPEYMLPAAYVKLEALPLTPNGKLDRKALPAPEGDGHAVRKYEAPQGEVETTLAGIWADVLKVERVGRHDQFFELGGHSLLAVTLIERMRQKGLHADVRALFSAPTLAEVAAAGSQGGLVEVPPSLIPLHCDAITPEMLPLVELSAREIEQIVSSVPGGARNVQDIYPLAPLQEGILFHHLMTGEGDPYLLAVLYSFDSRARLDGYLDALQVLMDRHDILRTSVVWEGLHEPVQVVWREAPMPVEEIQFDPAGGDVAEQLKRRFDPRHHRIDVRQAPLNRAYITYDAANERWLLLMLLHHLVGDHMTLEVMNEEIQAHLLGQDDRLPAPLPFRNFVAQARLGVSQEEHERFFRKLLGDVDEPTAPFGLLNVHGDGSEIEEARLEVDAGLARRLRERARKLGISAASLCHLAWAQVLARVSGREDVVFGTVLFGRMQAGEGGDRVLGLFINTLPARIRVGEEGVEASARATHTQLAELLRHEHASLALAQRCSMIPAPAPLFSALLNYRHSPGMTQAPSAEAIQAWEGIQRLYAEERTNYPFTLSVSDLGKGFILTAQVSALVGPMRVCEFMHTALEGLVEALEKTPAKATRSIDVLPEAERRQLLVEWNDTATEYRIDKCIHELFEEQAERSRDRVAVVYEGKQLTYGGAQRAGQPPGASSNRTWSWAGSIGWDLRGSLAGNDRWSARDTEGGRSIPATGP